VSAASRGPRSHVATDPSSVESGAGAAATLNAQHPVPGALVDPTELLDVDADQLARPLSLMALSGL